MAIANQDSTHRNNATSGHSQKSPTNWRNTFKMAENLTEIQRYAQVARFTVTDKLFRFVRQLPGVNIDHPRLEPLKSDHPRLKRWRKQAFGTPGKPAALEAIPWNYVRDNEDTIPFLGLREYWYPALKSSELYHNDPKPVTMLGDNLVFFRNEHGKACALEDRCPHRSPLLSLGQVGVVAPGTITCRYHGMTFDGEGTCVAFIADGPDSPACTTIRARTYPVEEVGGVIWVYMGDNDPQPLLESLPYAKSMFAHDSISAHKVYLPFNHLNTLDNDIDLSHPSILHRTCAVFSGQKVAGQIIVEDTANGGLRARYIDDVVHPGKLYIDSIEWHLPNLAYISKNDMPGGGGDTYAWGVPNDVGNTTFWFISAQPQMSKLQKLVMAGVMQVFSGRFIEWPGSPQSCVDAADASMMASQGRVARWDLDRLARTDRGITAARKKIKQAYAAECAERETAGRPHRRIVSASQATN